MTTYDIAKVRAACLELMGWKPCPNPMDCAIDDHMHDSHGKVVTIAELSNPTTSLDDALPLMEKYEIICGWADVPEDPCSTCGRATVSEKRVPVTFSYFDKSEDDSVAETNRALAICLCALRCAGRDLKDFEVKA